MKVFSRISTFSLILLAATADFAYGAQPPNVVESDPNNNTAMGTSALSSLTDGSYNTAAGAYALYANTTADFNTAAGYSALFSNATGNSNTAFGSWALISNSTGNANTAQGSRALYNNSTGIRNVAVGYSALFDNTEGRSNTAIGAYAGRRITGDDNIAVANSGVAGESQTMRIGTQGSEGVIYSGVTRTFIAGINGVTTSRAGTMVVVDSKGQLGTISSSREVKENIHPMGTASERLLALRPVTFQYKQANDDGSKPIQFGLIAEEIAEVFPELVLFDEAGKPQTVGYHLLASLLLNEFQKEHAIVLAQDERIATLEKQTEELVKLKQDFARMAETISKLDHVRMVAATH